MKSTENIQTEHINFYRIKNAIEFITTNYKQQPSLDEVAEKIHLSPSHFQRLFLDWAGVSPKKFLQYLNVEHAKNLLKEQHTTLADAAFETGLSGTGRLHDLFIQIEGMTPGEYKNAGENLTINYSFAESPFGNIIIASTTKGICYMAFIEDENEGFEELIKQFSKATFQQKRDLLQQNALSLFGENKKELSTIKLHLKGTPFQLKVWQALLKIPMGKLANYSGIAEKINSPKASRAVGSAIGDNPVAFLIPCHRVIQSSGLFGQYHWGSSRKAAMIGWEVARTTIQ